MSDFVEEVQVQNTLATQRAIVEGLDGAAQAMFASFVPDSREDKARLVNAASDNGTPLADYCGQPIQLVDVVVMAVEVSNDDHTASTVPRCCLLAADGAMYAGTSWGLYKALQKLFAVFGTLHFEADNPLTVEAVRVKTKKGHTFNLRVI